MTRTMSIATPWARRATDAGRLWILPALVGRCDQRGRVVLTKKFIEGVRAYADLWPGEVAVGMLRDSMDIGSLDEIAIAPDEMPFHFEWLSKDAATMGRGFDEPRAGVALISLVEPMLPMIEACRRAGIAVVCNAEYTLRTRRQIVRMETRNPIVRLRRLMWVTRQETRFRSAVALADAVQCNGTPTFEAYRGINRNALLYFDSRISADEIVADDVLQRRIDRMRAGTERQPLRLAFSGRLMPMKGADHLPRIIAELRKHNVSFTFDICGDGPSRSIIERFISRHRLGDIVRMRGVLDFHRELLPLLARDIDLFVCPHTQGDPSCTYLETFACGVPIAGYGNEAFAGLMRLTGAGWAMLLGDPAALAARIADLNSNRDRIAAASAAARAFANQHTFPDTMSRRVEHLLACLRETTSRNASSGGEAAC